MWSLFNGSSLSGPFPLLPINDDSHWSDTFSMLFFTLYSKKIEWVKTFPYYRDKRSSESPSFRPAPHSFIPRDKCAGFHDPACFTAVELVLGDIFSDPPITGHMANSEEVKRVAFVPFSFQASQKLEDLYLGCTPGNFQLLWKTLKRT